MDNYIIGRDKENINILSNQEKVIALYKFILDLSAIKQKVVLNVKSYDWYFDFESIPNDEKNIGVFYRDRVEEEIAGTITPLLSVHKPEFQRCPEPDSVFLEWLIEGWQSFHNEVRIKKTIERQEDKEQDNLTIENFDQDENRINSYEKWLDSRAQWVEKQNIIDKTRAFFSNLYKIHIDLERESETLEMVVANGFIRDRSNDNINHPIITRRVTTKFDSIANTISIEDSDVETELYTMLLHVVDDINLVAISSLRDELYRNDYHPMDRNETPEFLEMLIHKLSGDSLFSRDGEPEKWDKDNRLLMYTRPCFIVRKRVDGTLKAVEKIIENIEETGQIPSPLIDIVSGGQINIPDDYSNETIEEQLAAVGGESIDILLSKEANKEQLQIAQRIENYNAVLVQGPPGTGKTHTIANLMGHFLAQGKSVLVTSHTKKALTVLKEKITPGLQNLCVSILDDSNLDMEKSIDGITEYMSRYTSHELKRQMVSAEVERREIIEELANTRKKLFSSINREYKNIILNGEEISPSKAAAFVLDYEDTLSYIPGNVNLYEPLPLTFLELSDLYRSNEEINFQEELELSCGLPDPSKLLSPKEYEITCKELMEIKHYFNSISELKGWSIDYEGTPGSIDFSTEFGSFQVEGGTEENLTLLGGYCNSLGDIQTWMKHAAVDGKIGGSHKQRWIILIDQIKKTCDYADSVVSEQFGKTIIFEPKTNLDDLVPILEKMKEHFTRKSKLTKLDLFFNSNFQKILSEITINGDSIHSEHDCEIALDAIELAKERNLCADYWNELLSKRGVPEFASIDVSEPERIAEKWIDLISRYLNWYQNDYELLEKYLLMANIPSEIVFPKNMLDSELIATEKILKAIHDRIPSVVDACKAGLKSQGLKNKLNMIEAELQFDKRIGSISCGEIFQAMRDEDTAKYEKSYQFLEKLYIKYNLQENRDESLNKIANVAPQWAESIRGRIGIHGNFSVPITIEDAWKWKQYNAIIADIMKDPFDELQAKSNALGKKYREITAQFAEKKAWYQLMQRTELDIDMKQALQGWKLTVRKIGKGTGKNAPLYKAKARELMAKCQTAVPAWIMPINKALESLDPKNNKFDVIIVDEASQSDVCSLAIAYMAKKLIVVGDDKQVSPMAVGSEIDQINALIKIYLDGVIPNSHLYTPTTSLYDVASMTFQPLLLKEHFRSVPEIIGFSNSLSYDFKIKPLRDASSSNLLPAVVNYRVADGKREASRKENPKESKAIVSLLMACMEQPEYERKTFGVISMRGEEQAKRIQALIFENIDPKDIESRKILCGIASNFQGDERDVIFLSLVDSNPGEGPLNMQEFGPNEAYRKRYNVATSRAKDQLWVVDSLDSENDLKPGDIRKRLIDYSLNPKSFENKCEEIEKKSESAFETTVGKMLVSRGYNIVPQWEVGAYRIDMVALYEKRIIAIECDGERWHSGEEKIREDMERQTILERIGWRFIRIRGSEFYRNPENAIERVILELTEFGIKPEVQDLEPESSRTTELLQRTKARATTIFKGFKDSHSESIDFSSIEFALKSSEVINSIPEKNYDKKQDDFENKKNIIEKEVSKKLKKLNEENFADADIITNDVITLIKSTGTEYIDKRDNGGALWVIGKSDELSELIKRCKNMGIHFTFKGGGGRATKNRDAWWSK